MNGKKRTAIRLWALAMAMAIIGSVPVPAVAANKVGYIDIQKLVTNSNIGKAARIDLERLKKSKQAVIKKSRAELTGLTEEFNKKSDRLNESQKRMGLAAIRDKEKQHKRLVADIQELLQRKDLELVASILKKADKVLKKIAKNNGYSLIIKDASVLGYIDPEVDITDLVIQGLNRQS